MPAILGPEMAAPILWAPGKIAFFQQENRHAHKIPRFRGVFVFIFGGGGGECRFYFHGCDDFLTAQSLVRRNRALVVKGLVKAKSGA